MFCDSDITTNGGSVTVVTGGCNNDASSGIYSTTNLNINGGEISVKVGSCNYNNTSVEAGPALLTTGDGTYPENGIHFSETYFNVSNKGTVQNKAGYYNAYVASNASRPLTISSKSELILKKGVSQTGTG